LKLDHGLFQMLTAQRKRDIAASFLNDAPHQISLATQVIGQAVRITIVTSTA
jgi:hypothetical protein